MISLRPAESGSIIQQCILMTAAILQRYNLVNAAMIQQYILIAWQLYPRRDLSDNLLSGPIPSVLGSFTQLVNMCVGCVY